MEGLYYFQLEPLDVLNVIDEQKCRELKLPSEFNQCIINNYYPGQGISKHIDDERYGDVIGCFTLNGGCNMLFEYYGVGRNSIEQRVEPNSLYIMSGESRYRWLHSMPQRKSDYVNGKKIKRVRRVSVTFRKV